MKFNVACLLLVGALAITPFASASPLLPGTTAFPDVFAGSPGTLLVSSSTPVTSAVGKWKGTLTAAVYKTPAGTLDFLYQFTNNRTCPKPSRTTHLCDDIVTISNTDFSGFSTDVGINPLGVFGPFMVGFAAPSTVSRTTSGSTVNFNFSPLPLQPGFVSVILEINTNATSFDAGATAIIDGGATTVTTFEPTGPTIPEPASLTLLGSGFLGLAAFIRRKLSA